jgi:hypothetical protein
MLDVVMLALIAAACIGAAAYAQACDRLFEIEQRPAAPGQ